MGTEDHSVHVERLLEKMRGRIVDPTGLALPLDCINRNFCHPGELRELLLGEADRSTNVVQLVHDVNPQVLSRIRTPNKYHIFYENATNPQGGVASSISYQPHPQPGLSKERY